MAAITNTATTITTKGIREDLEDTIYRVAPEKTPFQNNIGSGGKASQPYHEWQTEGLDTPVNTNAQVEGDDIPTTFAAETPSVRVGNYCQIFRKTGLVSGTDEAVKKAGRKSELNRQKVLKGIALRTDMEMTFMSNIASLNDSGGVARKCGGILAWIATNNSFGAGGSAGGFATGIVAAATPGTTRTFSESIFQSVRQTAFGNGATPSQLYAGPADKAKLSKMTGISNVRNEVKGKVQATVIGGVDVYVDDFGDVTFIPHAYAITGSMLLIEPAMVGVATLRPVQTETMAQTGDAEKFMIIAEKTLVCRNEKAHAAIRAI